MVPPPTPTILAEGYGFPESPRWHEGLWWVSDLHRRQVLSVDPAGGSSVVAEVPGRPSGLGWLPDGRLAVASMRERRVLCVDDGGQLSSLADLSKVVLGPINDMVVTDDGHIYVGCFGLWDGQRYGAANLAVVKPDGVVAEAAGGLAFPNGLALSGDGGSIICAETHGHRLTAWDRRDDGSLTARRVWADLGCHTPDGLAIDADGAVWVADPFQRVVLHVAEGGEILDQVEMGGRGAFACALGGTDGRSLLICSNIADVAAAYNNRHLREGRLEVVRV
jgi:sugar lactone lactonase YvrE